MFKQWLIIVSVLAVVGIGYFASLHRSQERILTNEDRLLQRKLAEMSDAATNPPAEKESGKAQEDIFHPMDYGRQAPPALVPIIVKQGRFNPQAQDSDFLHRGRGDVSIVRFMDANRLVLSENFHVTNGPDYRIYFLAEQGVETEARFLELKADAIQLARLTQFSGYQVFEIPAMLDVGQVHSVLIWCEAFGQFITSADIQ